MNTIVKLGSCSSLLKSLNSTLQVSIQKQKEQSWRYHLSAQLLKAGGRIIFTFLQLTKQMRYIQMTFQMSPKKTLRMPLWITFWTFSYKYLSSTKSQKSNVWCLLVLSSFQNLQHPIPISCVKCPISIFQKSWQLVILSKFPFF